MNHKFNTNAYNKEFRNYLNEMDGKNSYVWDKLSIFNNKYPVRLVFTNAKGDNEGMMRSVSGVYIEARCTDDNKHAGSSANFPAPVPLENVMRDVNNIINFCLERLKVFNKNFECIEAYIIPTEIHLKIRKKIIDEK